MALRYQLADYVVMRRKLPVVARELQYSVGELLVNPRSSFCCSISKVQIQLHLSCSSIIETHVIRANLSLTQYVREKLCCYVKWSLKTDGGGVRILILNREPGLSNFYAVKKTIRNKQVAPILYAITVL